jgi:hypothetical protein
MPTAKVMPPQVVFNLFSLEELITHILGNTPAGLVASESGRSRSTVENWFRTNAISKLMAVVAKLLPESASDELRCYLTGQFPYPSNMGGLLYPQLGEIWSEYRTSLKQLHNVEVFEVSNREHFPARGAASLIEAILAAHEVCPRTPPQAVRAEAHTIMAGRLKELESDWERGVATAFFHQLAALDIDACQSNFAGRQIRMLLPLVFPSRRPGLTGKLYIPPELNLLELMYCAVMGEFEAPTLKEMLGTLDVDLETKFRGKHRRGTFRLDDYYLLTKHWWKQSPQREVVPEPSGVEVQRRNAFLLMLFVAAKVCSFVFKDVPDDAHLDAITQRFLSNYREAWRFQVVVRGLNPAAGQPWEGSHVQKLLFRRSTALEAALTA